MDRTAGSGLEIKPSTFPEVAPQYDENKYYMGGGPPNDSVFDQPNQSDQSYQPQAKSQGRSRAYWVLGIIAVLCLAVAIGAGLGAGLAAQHKSTSSSSSSSTPVTIIQAINASVTATQSSKEAISAPITVTLSADSSTITPTPTTLPSPTCPTANGSTYVATNKPQETKATVGSWQISNTSLSFEILCNTNIAQGGSVLDLQVIENISSLNNCLDQCALFNFRASNRNFPALGCTGIGWTRTPYELCWLKSNVTLASPNIVGELPPSDGAVLLGV